MRDVNTLKGLHSARTMHSARKRSIPRIQSSPYLDLYMLNKEKERLMKEDQRLSMRKDAINKRLEEINLEMNKIEEAEAAAKANGNTSSSERASGQRKGAEKEWRKMRLHY